MLFLETSRCASFGIFNTHAIISSNVSFFNHLLDFKKWMKSIDERTVLFEKKQSKNTCAHNNTEKAHRNGIKVRQRTRYVSQKGKDPKFLRNQKFAKKYNGSKRTHDE